MGASLIFAVVAVLVILGPIARYGRAFQSEVQADNAMRGALALQVAVARAIEREWDSLQAVAGNASNGDLDTMRRFANAVLRAGERIAWAGFADASGIVRAGAGGKREGEDVGKRRWFQEGLAGGVIGSVYRPDPEGSGSGQEEALINLSTPVISPNGETLGVFVYSLRITWLAEYLRSTAEELDLDAFILDRKGMVIAQRLPDGSPELSSEALERLQLNRNQKTILPEEDGPDMAYATVPNIGTANLPALRWSLLVRLPAIDPDSGEQYLVWTVLMVAGGLVLLLLVFVLVFTRVFLAPFSRLAEISREIAEDREVYPEEFFATRESALISQSLSRLQTRLQ